jgi:hypothetical protein
MPKYPNPTASKLAKSPQKVDRRVLCAGYEGCLDMAIKRNWRGFSCRKCRSFHPLQLSSIEWRLDSMACTVLLGVAEFSASFKQKPRGGIIDKLQRLQSRWKILGLG